MMIRNLLVGLPFSGVVHGCAGGVRVLGRSLFRSADGHRESGARRHRRVAPAPGRHAGDDAGHDRADCAVGVLFVLLGEFDELYEATYHSAVNFASLGYGDIVMSKPWKLLGPLEACCGVLMLGMTAAALMAILQQMIQTQREALKLD